MLELLIKKYGLKKILKMFLSDGMTWSIVAILLYTYILIVLNF